MHRPIKHARGKILTAAFTALFTAVALLSIGTPTMASHVSSHADITVVFTPDDMGFNATSTKGISNVIVEYCGALLHKHEDEFTVTPQPKFFNHTELQVIVSVYVKSGNNGIPGNVPPGAGERFLNAGVDCTPATTTTPPTTTAPSTSTTPPTTTTGEIPFFPSAAALALGTLGAIGGAFLVMRRRN